MEPARVRRRVPAPTVLQMMKLVVLGAVASSCLQFGVQLSKETHFGMWQIIIVEALVTPLATALVAFPLLRKGPLKDWLILALVAFALSVTLVLGIVAMAMDVIERISVQRRPLAHDFFQGAFLGIVIIGMPAIGLMYLVKRLVPGRCPDCRRLRLLPEAKFMVRSEARRGRSHQCLGCRGLYRNRGGFWEVIPTDPKPPKP